MTIRFGSVLHHDIALQHGIARSFSQGIVGCLFLSNMGLYTGGFYDLGSRLMQCYSYFAESKFCTVAPFTGLVFPFEHSLLRPYN